MSIFIGVDVGGTFTDFSVSIPHQNREILHKIPSTPANPDRAIIDGLAEILSMHQIDPQEIVRLAHGTTVGTNALIERRVGKVAVVTTAGFRDLLEIGRQTRPKVYDIHQDHPKPIVPRHLRLEVRERMRADGVVHVPLDEDGVERAGRQLAEEGVDCIAVCFLHSYAYSEHERRAAELLRRSLGNGTIVITSSSVYPEFREYERFSTTVLNAALLTVMNAYLDRFTRAVVNLGVLTEPTVSQSAGGLMSIVMARNFPIRSALSGPAAGVLGAAYRARVAGHPKVITLDVGGTSADVSLLSGGEPTLVHSRNLAGFPLRLPALDVNSVGAGGGSIAWIDRDGLLKVGPHSAGAVPGPACYDLGSEEATVTDANVLLGRLSGDALLDGRMPIRRDLAEASVNKLAHRLHLEPIETALGITRLACATMVKAIRSISIERGYDPGEFALFAFGGAGALHAPEIARELGIHRIIVPPSPGIQCAQGLLNSDLVGDFVQATVAPFDGTALEIINALLSNLMTQTDAWFALERVVPQDQRLCWAVDLRYKGQNFELSIPFSGASFDTALSATVLDSFHSAHERAYGFSQPNEPVELVSMRVKLIGVLEKPQLPLLPAADPGKPVGRRRVAFAREAWHDTVVYRRADLAPHQVLIGPAIIEQMDTTVLLYPSDQCDVDTWGNLIIELH